MIVVVILAGVVSYYYSSEEHPSFKYEWGECKSSLLCEINERNSLDIKVEEGVIHFNQTIYTICSSNPRFDLTLERSGYNLTILEIFSGGNAYCLCDYEISGEINDLKEGTYNLTIIFRLINSNETTTHHEVQVDV